MTTNLRTCPCGQPIPAGRRASCSARCVRLVQRVAAARAMRRKRSSEWGRVLLSIQHEARQAGQRIGREDLARIIDEIAQRSKLSKTTGDVRWRALLRVFDRVRGRRWPTPADREGVLLRGLLEARDRGVVIPSDTKTAQSFGVTIWRLRRAGLDIRCERRYVLHIHGNQSDLRARRTNAELRCWVGALPDRAD